MTPRSSLRTPTNRPLHSPQRWVEKADRSIKGSDTPHITFKVNLQARDQGPSTSPGSLLSRTFPRPRPPGGAVITARSGLVAFIALAALAPPAAHAEIIAAVDFPVEVSDGGCPIQTDLALIDPATGARSPLPDGISTSLAKVHPSINGPERGVIRELGKPRLARRRGVSTRSSGDWNETARCAQSYP